MTIRRVSVIISVVAITFTACTASRRQEQPTVRIGLGPWVGFGPLYLAQEKGLFSEAGIRAELIVLTGLSERNSALKSGRIDALAAPVDSFVLASGNGIPTKVVMAIDESYGGDGIVATKGIQSFADLRGKRVAFQRGLPSEFFLRALLEKNGMTLDDLRAVDMETAQAGAAFISRQLDAAGLWEPWLTRAADEGNGHVLASTKQFPDLIVDCLAFRSEVASRDPGLVRKVVGVVFAAIGYWKTNPDEANRIMAPHFQVDAAKYAAILSGLKFCDLQRNRVYFGSAEGGPIYNVAERASRIWRQAGAIASPVDPTSVVASQFVAEASR